VSGIAVPRHTEPVFWDPQALGAELGRVFDICHGCRRCWNVCPSFGTLFRRIGEIEDVGSAGEKAGPTPSGGLKPEGAHAAQADPSLLTAKNPVEGITDADRSQVVDECYQCKLCFNLCPYHPPHRFMLDFPRLMGRAKAVHRKKNGAPLFDRIAAQVDLIGRLNSVAAPIVNWMNRLAAFRVILEKTLGVDRRRNLPLFHGRTFRRWWDWRGPKARNRGRVALFYSCSVDYNEPQVGRAAVRVLEHNGFEVVCPEQSCCGMPHMDAGDLSSAEAAARKNVARLLPFAQQGVPIVALGPTCSLMLKEEYPFLLNDEASRLVARATFDISEFLMKLKREGRLKEDFQSEDRTISYHLPCHLKAQNMGFKSRDLLALIPGTKVSMIDRCSAHDGTWAMKKDYYDLSLKTGKKLFDEIGSDPQRQTSTDCPLAGLQITQGTGKIPKHPIEYVAQAYGLPDD
jgi:Fe-S oxidoreductase